MRLLGVDPAWSDPGSQRWAGLVDADEEGVHTRLLGTFLSVEDQHFYAWLANDHGVTPEESGMSASVLRELYASAFAVHKGDCWLCTRNTTRAAWGA